MRIIHLLESGLSISIVAVVNMQTQVIISYILYLNDAFLGMCFSNSKKIN